MGMNVSFKIALDERDAGRTIDVRAGYDVVAVRIGGNNGGEKDDASGTASRIATQRGRYERLR